MKHTVVNSNYDEDFNGLYRKYKLSLLDSSLQLSERELEVISKLEEFSNLTGTNKNNRYYYLNLKDMECFTVYNKGIINVSIGMYNHLVSIVKLSRLSIVSILKQFFAYYYDISDYKISTP